MSIFVHLVCLVFKFRMTKEPSTNLQISSSIASMGISLQIGGVPHGHHGHHHGHSHEELGHSSDSHGSSHKNSENLNVRAALIHVIGDFIQSLGVMIAAVVIYFYPHLQWIDPVCTFFFSILVLFTTYHIIKDVTNVLMEGKHRASPRHHQGIICLRTHRLLIGAYVRLKQFHSSLPPQAFQRALIFSRCRRLCSTYPALSKYTI